MMLLENVIRMSNGGRSKCAVCEMNTINGGREESLLLSANDPRHWSFMNCGKKKGSVRHVTSWKQL
jgi:hypothetical protein